MHPSPTPASLCRLCVSLALATALGCGTFREQPLDSGVRADAPTDRAHLDVTDAPDVSDARDVIDASDVAADVAIDVIIDVGPCGGGCPAGQSCCAARCVDLATDPTNCGSCAATCAAPNASSVCRNRLCVVEICVPGFADCDGNPLNGCEADLSSSISSCGACRAVCGSGGTQGPACDTGRCRLPCQLAAGDCDNDPANGCEANIYADPDHCGRCGNRCTRNHNAPDCYNGLCGVGVCEAGWANCNSEPRDGCETHTDGDVLNCGACGHACPSSAGMTATCAAGVCGTAAVTCADPRAECDGDVSSVGVQCETDLRTSAAHCGRCGNACSTTNATSTCVARACVLACAAGFGNCDGLANTGCETDTRVSVTNCGGCGQACHLANTDALACVGGACAPVTCSAGFGNCDAMSANGCETNTRTSVAHCGMCGHACVLPHATAACVASLCAVDHCDAGFVDCDHNAANGCETNVTLDPRNCGACGLACFFPNAANTCSAGRCVIGACSGPFGNCNTDPADGCEAYLLADPHSCGRCGAVCSPPFRCVGGGCIL